MDPQFQQSLDQLLKSVSVEQSVSALTLAVYLLLGGFMSIYVRFLYTKCGPSISDSDSVSRVFPLLTLVTIGVIAVVKSSMALSLGLVGALSIVRFRAAIKEPEELVYLFLCIGIGLSLGAGQPLLACVILIVASTFILGMYFSSGGQRDANLLLTITGDETHFSGAEAPSALVAIQQTVKQFRLQRFDVGSGRGQVRVIVTETDPNETAKWILRLRELLPNCDISYVSMNTL
jgi:Domain of unknown function (DUF4956)